MTKSKHLKIQACKLIGIAAISSLSLTTFASDYDTHWAKVPIEKWKQASILGGYTDGSFKPNNPITRAELAKIVSQVFGLTDTVSAKTYQDVDTKAWYALDVAKISSLGIMNDEATLFRPNDEATREEAAYLIANAYQLAVTEETVDFSDVDKIASWAKEEVTALRARGFISGKENKRFDPKGKLTRAEVAAMLDNITPNFISTSGTYTSVKKGNVLVKTRDVILKDMTITGDLYLAPGIGDGDVTLENVTINGKTYIAGGGVNSIKINNTILTGGAEVLSSHPVRVVSENSQIALSAAPNTHIILTGSFAEVNVPAGVQAELKQASVGTLTIAALEGSKPAVLKFDTTSNVMMLIAKAPLAASGTGEIQNLDVQAAGVTTEQKPTKTQVKEGITATIAGQIRDSATNDIFSIPAPVAGGGGGGGAAVPTTSLLDTLTGNVQLGSSLVNAQIQGGKIVFDLSNVSDTERLQGFTLSSGNNLSISLNEVSTDLSTNTNYGITDMIANTSTSEIKSKVGDSYSEGEINIAKAIIGAKSDISVGTARNIASTVGDYTYTGTITDSATGKSESITIEIRVD